MLSLDSEMDYPKLNKGDFFPSAYDWILISIEVQAIFPRPLHLMIIYKAVVDIIGYIPLHCCKI